MKTYTFQIFDSKNSCIKESKEFKREIQASNEAQSRSLKGFGKIIVTSDLGFEEFEKGILVSWSYPNGLGQIKINS